MKYLKEYELFEEKMFPDYRKFNEMKELCVLLLKPGITKPVLFDDDISRWYDLSICASEKNKREQYANDPLLPTFLNRSGCQENFDSLYMRIFNTDGRGQVLTFKGGVNAIMEIYGGDRFYAEILYFMHNNEVPLDWQNEWVKIK